MAREIIYRPSISRPTRQDLELDLEGRYFQVFHRDELICVCDSRIQHEHPDAEELTRLTGTSNWTIDWTTPEGVIRDIVAMAGSGGGLEDFEGVDLTVWRGGCVVAVIHHSLAVTSRTFNRPPVTYDSLP